MSNHMHRDLNTTQMRKLFIRYKNVIQIVRVLRLFSFTSDRFLYQNKLKRKFMASFIGRFISHEDRPSHFKSEQESNRP